MTPAVFAFYLFALGVIAGGLFTVVSRNPVHSVLWLILAFLSSAGLFVLLGAEFVAMLLVIVYVGAVAVLFLFVVMMLDINIDRIREGFWNYLPLGAGVGLLMVVEMGAILGSQYLGAAEAQVPQTAAGVSNVKELGRLLFTEYVYPFELASVILLVALIAAIVLTHRGAKKTKYTDPAKQVFVKAADRIRVLQMPAEKQD